MKHCFGQRCELRARHSAPHHGHQESGYLIVGNTIVRGALNEKFDFFAGKFRGIALFADKVNNTHEEGCANLASRRARRQSLQQAGVSIKSVVAQTEDGTGQQRSVWANLLWPIDVSRTARHLAAHYSAQRGRLPKPGRHPERGEGSLFVFAPRRLRCARYR